METVKFDIAPSRQDIMDAIFVRARDGKGRCFDDDTGICYYYKEGNRCFVGIFLEPDIFRDCRFGVCSLKDHDLPVPDWFEEHIQLLSDLQDLHDHRNYWSVDGKMYKDCLVEFCHEHDLEYRE